MPHYFVNGGKQLFENWLKIIIETDGAICISQSVASSLTEWLNEHTPKRDSEFSVDWFHLGSNADPFILTKGMPKDSEVIIKKVASNISFLMVGTIEPRKHHDQVLGAFEKLWLKQNINLVIVGKQGWMVDKFIEKLCLHPELGKRLFWLEGISDEYLEKVYAASTCLIAASEGEGFCLPLIEAAQHKLPIIARDIPVFREVAGKYAFYFSAENDVELAKALTDWLAFYAEKRVPLSEKECRS